MPKNGIEQPSTSNGRHSAVFANKPLPETAKCSSVSALNATGTPVVIPRSVAENYSIKVPRSRYMQNWIKKKPTFLKRNAPEILDNSPAGKRAKDSEEPRVIF